MGERAQDDDEGEAFHFVSYVAVNGFLYEMDGLQKGPRLIDSVDDGEWFQKARGVLQQRMASYQSKELRFTLLAVCGDQEAKHRAERDALKKRKDGDGGGDAMDCDDDQIDARLSALDDLIQNEQEKKRKWTVENIRRRHNYFPFILNLIGVLGKSNLLKELTERAKEKKKQKLERIEAEKKKRDQEEQGKATKDAQK